MGGWTIIYEYILEYCRNETSIRIKSCDLNKICAYKKVVNYNCDSVDKWILIDYFM